LSRRKIQKGRLDCHKAKKKAEKVSSVDGCFVKIAITVLNADRPTFTGYFQFTA